MADVYAQLERALQAEAHVADVQELLGRMKLETEGERNRAQEVLIAAMKAEVNVCKVVLDAMSKEVVLPVGLVKRGALYHALRMGRKEIVMAVAERMARETPYELNSWPLRELFRSPLFEDQEVVDAVIGVVPAATFKHCSEVLDCLCDALNCKAEYKERAVELCLKHGPSMEERLVGQGRLRYVAFAARTCGLETVQMMHGLVPLLADGSGRRADEAEYANAIRYASLNERVMGEVPAIMEYLWEQGGSGVSNRCHRRIVLNVRTAEAVDWVARRMPHLFPAVCREEYCLSSLIANFRLVDRLALHIKVLVDREVIVEMMKQRNVGSFERSEYGEEGWRWRLRALHKAVPECMDGLRFPWLMDAVKESAYNDVEYMLEICTVEHLMMRCEKGDRAFDVAARDSGFPEELLARLKVAAKGAHA